MQNGNNFQAVLFDLDGTLLDSVRDLAEAMNESLAHFGYPTHQLEAYKYFVGDGFKNLTLRAMPADKIADDTAVEACYTLGREIYFRQMDVYSRPYPGIEELLDFLSRQNYRLCILSNKPHDNTVFLVNKFFSRWQFEVVFGARPDLVPIKPHPGAALEISQLMGLAPENYLYLGDTSTDMKTANSAGMWPVGVLWGFRPRHELEEFGARWLLDHPMQLADYLARAAIRP